MTVKHYKIFCEVYAYRSFTKASEALNLTQPSVSIAIREMEEHYNTKFFIRTKKELGITPSAQKMIVFARNILRQIDKSEQAFRDEGDGLCLHIGSNVTSATSFLSNILLNNFKEDSKKKLYFCINNSSKIEKMVAQGELDVGFTDIPTSQQELISLPVTTEEVVLVGSPEFVKKLTRPLTLSELAKLPLLLREEGSGSRECINSAFMEIGLHPTPVMESTNNNTLLNCARHGLGILAIPKNNIQGQLKKGVFQKIECENVQLLKKQYFIIREDTELTPPIKLLINKIRNKFDKSSFAKYYSFLDEKNS